MELMPEAMARSQVADRLRQAESQRTANRLATAARLARRSRRLHQRAERASQRARRVLALTVMR